MNLKKLIGSLIMTFCALGAHPADLKMYKSEIRAAAKEYKIDPAHLLAIAEVESNFNPKAAGDKKHGSYRSHGMFQIRVKLHNITIDQARDVRWAARWACRYLKKRGYRKDAHGALTAYNGAGKRAARYCRKVLKAAEKYRGKDEKD